MLKVTFKLQMRETKDHEVFTDDGIEQKSTRIRLEYILYNTSNICM